MYPVDQSSIIYMISRFEALVCCDDPKPFPTVGATILPPFEGTGGGGEGGPLEVY